MHFNSLSFLIFFIFFALAFFSVKTARSQVNLSIIGSYIFYLLNGTLSLLFLLLLTIVTYFGAYTLSRRTIHRKSYLTIFLILILCIIAFSKYIISNSLIHWELGIFTILGISFYSLQAISLLLDVYYKRYSKPLDLRHVGLFLSFFPQAVAGPIHRAGELIPQFLAIKRFSSARTYKAIRVILFGLVFKLIVADKIGLVIDPVFVNWKDYSGLIAFISMHLYSLQIYFDFWGYSLIAIGLGHILGYNLKINFNYPYSVSSFKLFWKRWHISLSQWMRDYIYIPLVGKNKKNRLRFLLAIYLTFFVSAIWHGLEVNFILWGVLHATFYLIEDYARKHISHSILLKKLTQSSVAPLIKKIIFFNLLSITWLVFRTSDFKSLMKIIQFTFNIDTWTFDNLKLLFTTQNTIYLSIALFVIYFSKKMAPPSQSGSSSLCLTKNQKYLDFAQITISLILLFLFGDLGTREFLYFKF